MPVTHGPADSRRLVGAARRWLAPLLAALLLAAPRGAGPVLAQQRPVLVRVAPVVERRDVEAGQAFVGTVRPLRHSSVGSAVDGRVIEFPVNQGDWVEEGQPLAQLLTETLSIQIEAAKAEHDLRRRELEELENGSRPEEIREAAAVKEAAAAAMEYAQARLKRTRTAFNRSAISEDQLQDDQSAAVRSANEYAAAVARHELIVAGPRAERIAQARARVAMAEAEVRRLEDQLAKHTIRAPFGGYVVAEHTEKGQWIKSGELVAEVVEVDRVEIEVPVLENYIPNLRLGEEARVELIALADEVLSGTVTAIVPLGDERSRSFPVRVTLENRRLEDRTPLVKPGMFARVWLPVERRAGVLMVPKDALVLGGAQRMAFVVDRERVGSSEGTVRAVPLELGISQEGMVEVRGALRQGDLVVVEGNERLQGGQKATILNVEAEGR